MDSLKKGPGRYGPAFLAVLVVGWLLIVPNPATFGVAPPLESPFGNLTVNQPVAVAASLGRVLVTRHCSTQVLSISGTQGSATVSVFATLPAQGLSTCEDYLAIVPAQPNIQTVAGFPTPFFNGFTSNDVYVTQGPNITKISFDGSTVSAFATLPSCAASGNGITFDRPGTFGHNMIVACANGPVWLLNGSGQTVKVDGAPTRRPIATIPITTGQIVEGPDVAPASFGSFGGQLLVTVSPIVPTVPPTGNVVAVNPSNGKTSVVAAVPTAESVALIPTTKCAFGLSSATYFTAAFGTNAVDFLPLIDPNTGTSVFAGLGGTNALVTSEGSANGAGITLLSSTGGTSTFESFVTEHQGSAFVDCTTPLLLQASRTEAALSIGPGAIGVSSVFILQEPNFNPLTICVGTTTADGSQPCLSHVPTYGVTGTEQSFKECGKSLVSSGSGPALECKFFKNLESAQAINKFTGTLIIKVKTQGPTGDDAEGGT
jgi:hypothetical protein